MDKKILVLAMLFSLLLVSGATAAVYKVKECEDDIDVDGDSDDDGWEDAAGASFGNADFSVCFDRDNLYFLVTTEDNSSDDGDLVTIWIDTDGDDIDDDDELEDDDLGFEINRDGDRDAYEGEDDGSNSGWAAEAEDNDEDGWAAEFRFPLSLLGVSGGEDTEMGLAIFVEDSNGTDATLPSGAKDDEPDTWNSMKPKSGPWGGDTAPTLTNGKAVPVSVAVGAPGTYNFEVTYKDAEGDAPTSINVYVNGIANAMVKDSASCSVVTGCKYVNTKALAEGTYSFYFQAANDGGNARNPASTNLEITISVQNRKPVIGISSHATGAKVRGVVQIAGVASDPDGASDIEKVEVKIDSGRWNSAVGTSTWQYTYDATNADEGAHVVYVRAVDQDDAESDPVSIVLNVENNKPPVTPPRDEDTDDDGMPDVWELAYGLDPKDAFDAGLDNDKDGLTNLEEYTGGTSPLKSNKVAPPVDNGTKKPAQEGTLIWVLVIVVILAIAVIAFLVGRGGGGNRREWKPPEVEKDRQVKIDA